MTREFEGKVALVTGAGMGIGRASALAFARRGARVAVADVDVAGGEETVRLIENTGSSVFFLRTDVSDAAAVHSLIEKTVETYGRLDYAHNNAGVTNGIGVPSLEAREEDWDVVLKVNLKGVWLCMKQEIRQMLKQGGGGAIVNTSSISGLSGAPADPAYVASKFGVVGLTKTMAMEFGRSNIRINCVCPGPIRTALLERVAEAFPGADQMAAQMNPMGRTGAPEEIAEAVVWLCSNGASYVNGLPLSVDGGLAAL